MMDNGNNFYYYQYERPNDKLPSVKRPFLGAKQEMWGLQMHLPPILIDCRDINNFVWPMRTWGYRFNAKAGTNLYLLTLQFCRVGDFISERTISFFLVKTQAKKATEWGVSVREKVWQKKNFSRSQNNKSNGLFLKLSFCYSIATNIFETRLCLTIYDCKQRGLLFGSCLADRVVATTFHIPVEFLATSLLSIYC